MWFANTGVDKCWFIVVHMEKGIQVINIIIDLLIQNDVTMPQ